MTFQLITIFSLLHIVGAALGAAYCTLAEIFYIKAASDGVVDKHERKYLRRLFRVLQIALPIVLCSAVGLIVLQYLVIDAPQRVLTAPFWASQTLVLVMILFGYTLEKRQSPWWIGSSAILMGWWMLAAIDFGYLNSFGYGIILLIYLLVTFLAAGIVGYARMWFWRPKIRNN